MNPAIREALIVADAALDELHYDDPGRGECSSKTKAHAAIRNLARVVLEEAADFVEFRFRPQMEEGQMRSAADVYKECSAQVRALMPEEVKQHE